MARADLLKRLFEAYQRRDEQGFRTVASEIIEDERRKQHPVLANELQRILSNGMRSLTEMRGDPSLFEPVPTDKDRGTPLLAIRTPDRYLDDLVLDERTRASVTRIMAEVRGWEILEAHGLLPTRRVLFCGPSGCGKTSTAEALALEMSLPMLYVRFDSVVSSLLGATASNLRSVFEYANRGQWVLFFDEFDAIGRSRDDPTEHGEIKRVVNTFLQLLDSFESRSLVVAATNFEQALDPAIWRRFDDVLRFGLPDPDALDTLIRRRCRPVRVSERQIRALLEAVAGATFADAERICLDVRRLSALAGSARLRDGDLHEVVDRSRCRRDVLRQVQSGGSASTMDREADAA